MEVHTEERVEDNSLETNQSGYAELRRKYEERLNSKNRKETSFNRKKELTTLTKRLKDYKTQNKGLSHTVQQLKTDKAECEKKILDLEKNITTVGIKHNSVVQELGRFKRQNEILKKTLISKESAVKQFMCEFKKNQDTFDLSTQEGLHGFLARQEQVLQPQVRQNSRNYDGVKQQNYLNYQDDLDLSRITEYTEQGTPYDKRRTLLPHNDYYVQSGEQSDLYGNLDHDQTNGPSTYSNPMMQLSTTELNQSSNYNQMATTSHRNSYHHSYSYKDNSNQSYIERTLENPEEDSLDSSFLNKQKTLKKRRSHPKNYENYSTDGSESESSVDADGEDSDDEEKRRLEYENDDPDLRDCEWAHSSDEELMFRSLGIDSKLDFRLRDWDVKVVPVAKKPEPVNVESICLISSDEDEGETPSPQQSADSVDADTTAKLDADTTAKSELTLKFNTDPVRVTRCRNRGYDVETFVNLDSSGFAKKAMPSFEEYLTGDSEDDKIEDSAEDSEPDDVNYSDEISDFDSEKEESCSENENSKIFQTTFDGTQDDPLTDENSSEHEEFSEEEVLNKSTINDDTVCFKNEEENTSTDMKDNNCTADNTFDIENNDESVSLTNLDNSSCFKDTDNNTDNSNLEDSLKSALDDGDDLEDTKEESVNDFGTNGKDCNVDNKNSGKNTDDEGSDSNICDQPVLYNSSEQDNFEQTIELTDAEPTKHEQDSTYIPEISSGGISKFNMEDTEGNDSTILNHEVNYIDNKGDDGVCLPVENLDEEKNINIIPTVSDTVEEQQKQDPTDVNKINMSEKNEDTKDTISRSVEDKKSSESDNVTNRRIKTTKNKTDEQRKLNSILNKDDSSENKCEGLLDTKHTSSTDLTEQPNPDFINTTRRKSKRNSKVPKKYEQYFINTDEDVSRELVREDDASLPEQKSRSKSDSDLNTTQKRSSNTVNDSEPKKKRQKQDEVENQDIPQTPKRRSTRIQAYTPSKSESKSDSETLKSSKQSSKKRRKSSVVGKKVVFKTPPKSQSNQSNILNTKRTRTPSQKLRDAQQDKVDESKKK